jgi:hypothetical protein
MFDFPLTVHAGNHARLACPVKLRLPKDAPVWAGTPVEALSLRDDSGQPVPVQWSDEGDAYCLQWIVRELPARASRGYRVTSQGPAAQEGVILSPREGQVDITVDGAPFTAYVFASDRTNKPYLGPVLSAAGEEFTRLDLQTTEHPHQRSVWVAIGDVNGLDFWNEPNPEVRQRLQQFTELTSGPVYGRLVAENCWESLRGEAATPVIDEQRALTIYATGTASRIIDVELTFTAKYGKVEFGATKEAGPLGTRIAEARNGNHGGLLRNAYGALGEAECWGRRAAWCAYSGAVDGRALGFALFDHPANTDYPTYWHCRDGGLMAANNLYFIGGKLLQPGDTIRYQYRLYFHEGDTLAGEVSERYHDYLNPPTVTVG